MIALLTGVGFTMTGCYDDPHYYGHRSVRGGYYASAPAPYYGGYDPYGYSPYGYGYGSGIGIGVSSYRSGYRDRPYYGRDPYYGRNRYNRNRGYYRNTDRRNWDGRRRRDRDRSWEGRPRGERRASGERNRAIRRSTAPAQPDGERVEAQPE
jgi:hypothetical protein